MVVLHQTEVMLLIILVVTQLLEKVLFLALGEIRAGLLREVVTQVVSVLAAVAVAEMPSQMLTKPVQVVQVEQD
jgi:hypothetical protein